MTDDDDMPPPAPRELPALEPAHREPLMLQAPSKTPNEILGEARRVAESITMDGYVMQ